MELKFEEEMEELNKLGFLNPNDLSKEYIETLPVRYGTRVIVFTEDDKVILINLKHKHTYTLIGGNIDDGENIEDSMRRECKEESGYDLDKVIPLGYIEIWKNKYRRFVFGFIAKTKGDPSELKLTEKEIESGHTVELHEFEEAINILDNEGDGNDNLSSIRSLMFMEESKKYLKYFV